MKRIFVFCFILFSVPAFSQFQVNNDAVSLGGGTYRLTQALNNQAGSVWYKLQHDLNDPLNVQGQMYFGTSDGGADGISFVLQNNCLAAGTAGGGIGYEGMPGQSMAVEFDTYQNIVGTGSYDNSDPVYDHIAVEKAGNVNHANAANTLVAPLQMHATKADIEDGLWYDFQISYNPTTKLLSVYFDNTLRVSLTYDIKTNIFGGNPFVYWGFTSSTGGSFAEQKIFINSNLTTYTLTDQTTCNTPITNVELPSLNKYIGTNVALNKPATVSSVEGGGTLTGVPAFDGNMSTRWSSAFADPQWIYVDLVTIFDLDSVVLYWEGAYGDKYKIQVSNDASAWTDVYTENAGNGGKDKLIFSATNVRYVRMYGTHRATGYGYSLWEFQVYGKAKYVWSPNDGSISDIYSATPTFTPTVTTNYSVVIPDPCTGSVTYNMKITVDCALPASLLSFNAMLNDDYAQLNWSTSQEDGVSYFQVMKSTDGINFVPVGIVKASGNSSSIKNYVFNDPEKVEGIVYYQLKIVDKDGSSSESEIKKVAATGSVISIKNNPFEDEAMIMINEKSDVRIQVIDMLGRVLFELEEKDAMGEMAFGKTLAPAFYLVQVETALERKTFKVLKTR